MSTGSSSQGQTGQPGPRSRGEDGSSLGVARYMRIFFFFFFGYL
jgi:hypothetical protein